MLKTKKGESILRFRWGSKRSAGHILRVDKSVRLIIDRLAEFDRRRWVTDVINFAWSTRLCDPVVGIDNQSK